VPERAPVQEPTPVQEATRIVPSGQLPYCVAVPKNEQTKKKGLPLYRNLVPDMSPTGGADAESVSSGDARRVAAGSGH